MIEHSTRMWVALAALALCIIGAIVNSALHGDASITVALVGAITVLAPAAIEAGAANSRTQDVVDAHLATRRTFRGDIPIPDVARRAADDGPTTRDLGPPLPPRDPPT